MIVLVLGEVVVFGCGSCKQGVGVTNFLCCWAIMSGLPLDDGHLAAESKTIQLISRISFLPPLESIAFYRLSGFFPFLDSSLDY